MWIELSEFNLKLFLPLIFPVFKRIQDLTKKLYIKKSYDDHTLFKTFRYYLCHTLAFIPFLIVYFRTKKAENVSIEIKEENNEKLESKTTLTPNDVLFQTNTITDLKIANTRKKRLKSYLFLGGLCLMSLLCYYYRYFFEKKEYREFKQSSGIFFDIGGYILFSYLILKQKLYLHSFVSMGIIGVLLIALFIMTTFCVEDKNIIWKSLVYYLFYILFFILYDVLKKKYMNKFFNTPYFMMLVIGIFGCVFVLIYDFIAFLIDKDNEEVAYGFRENIQGAREAFSLILDLIIHFIWNLGIWLTIYYLTPCHTFMSEYISEYIYYIQDVNNPPNKEFYKTHNVVIFSIVAFINFCCCLVFNEVVILNFCNLDYNTNKRIQERQRHESKQTTQAQILLDSDDDVANIEMSSQNSN
jgi:hypothetical protein